MEKGNLAVKYDGVFLTIQEVARELRLTKNDIVSLVENNQLRAELIANKYRFRVIDVERFILGETTGEKEIDAVSLYKQQEINTYNKVGGKKVIGSIAESDGRFIVQFSLGKKPDGSRKRESKTFKSREMAEEYKKNRAEELNRSVTNKQFGEYKFKEYAEYYLNTNIYGAKTRTIAGYSAEIKAVNDLIGHIVIKELTESDIRTSFEKLSNTYKNNVLSKKWTVTRMILRFATTSGHIGKNPTEFLKKPKSKIFDTKDKESKAYTEEELNRIFQATSIDKEIDAMFRVLQSTGMRPGELRALRWKDYNVKDKTIKIISAATRDYLLGEDILDIKKYREIISSTKSIHSVRTLNLSDTAIKALDTWRDHLLNNENKEKCNSIYVFPGPNGDFMKEKSFNSKIYKFRKKHELDDIGVTPYRFRHTLCTNLVRIGTPEQIILQILGDSTHNLITRVYSHISRKDTEEHSQKLFDSMDNY